MRNPKQTKYDEISRLDAEHAALGEEIQAERSPAKRSALIVRRREIRERSTALKLEEALG